MLSGILGASAWMISHAILVGPGAWSNIMTMMPFVGFRSSVDGAMVLLFYLMAIVGAVIAIKEILKDKARPDNQTLEISSGNSDWAGVYVPYCFGHRAFNPVSVYSHVRYITKANRQ